MKYFDDLIYWIQEREDIRAKKQLNSPQPWTKNPVLQKYRFCNVHREDDRVTKWIHSNWLNPNRNHKHIAFGMGLARMVNLPESLEALGFPYYWEPKDFIETLADRKLRNKKVWTSAYMITGGYSVGGEPKEVIIARVLSKLYCQLLENPVVEGDTLEQASKKVQVPGIGSFLSAQIIADLKFSPLLIQSKDWITWCAPGPGSTMGLNFLHERPQSESTNPEQFCEEVNEIRELIGDHTGIYLCAQNTQNCLCELSKYIRAKYFNGRLKSQYVPYTG